jgi:hypothetical protein
VNIYLALLNKGPVKDRDGLFIVIPIVTVVLTTIRRVDQLELGMRSGTAL